ncbi:unnamed protein product [Dimorphilus gyrociliatus]|uniref:Uncharacterized protein n=1 Tax=Dimorphilus gyrociliatus TaxID=2664684 RepID=A0A7I8W4H5_9ANNE|nr:unnamed protein product [Dimorphilus gyrociliatus]
MSDNTMEKKLDAIEGVDIDADGRFKYILIKVGKGSINKLIVRGYDSCGYHADILDLVEPGIRALGFEVDCVGGGRILHEPNKKSILVYGYSQGFGRADHAKTVEILKRQYPAYNITYKNEGY